MEAAKFTMLADSYTLTDVLLRLEGMVARMTRKLVLTWITAESPEANSHC